MKDPCRMICRNVFLVALLLQVTAKTTAFSLSSTRGRRHAFSTVTYRLLSRAHNRKHYLQATLLRATENDDYDKGMEEAFRELESLDSLDGLDGLEESLAGGESLKNIEGKIDKEELKGKAPNVAPEEEIKQYSELYEDLQGEEKEDALYSEVLRDLGGSVKPSAEPEQSEMATPQISTTDNGSNIDDFMNTALEQALKEAKDRTPEQVASLSENVLDDEDMMKEIRGVFDKANEELLQGLEEIRREQSELARASAEKSSQERVAAEKQNEFRMEQAQKSMVKVLENVNKETEEVERAVVDLKKAQEAMDADPVMKLVSGDLVKQAALAGTLLFSVRALVEAFAMVSGGGDGAGGHAVAALVQGAIGLACGAYFFLK